MPIYEFRPCDLDNLAWIGSTDARRCRVHARDERHAREILTRELKRATDNRNADGTIPTSPWLVPALAECVGSAEGTPSEYREGLIEVYNEPPGSRPLSAR